MQYVITVLISLCNRPQSDKQNLAFLSEALIPLTTTFSSPAVVTTILVFASPSSTASNKNSCIYLLGPGLFYLAQCSLFLSTLSPLIKFLSFEGLNFVPLPNMPRFVHSYVGGHKVMLQCGFCELCCNKHLSADTSLTY